MLETRSFALALYPLLKKDGYDIVHYNDLPMGSALFHLRHLLGGRFRLLYCNGAPSPPQHYHHRSDFAQVLTGPQYEEARAFGISENRLFLIPYGVDSQKFSPMTRSQRLDTRRELGIPVRAKVVLTTAALKRQHKRIDYLIKELTGLGRSFWLVAAGQPTEETESLKEEAERLLPGRWRFVSWPHERVHLLYGAADIFALASLSEGFGLAIVEAMLTGLPVIAHDGPGFRWVAGQAPVHLVNMAQDGEFSRAAAAWFAGGNNPEVRQEAVRRFSWEALVPDYIRMYETVAEATPATKTSREVRMLSASESDLR